MPLGGRLGNLTQEVKKLRKKREVTRQEDHLQAMTPLGGWSAQAMIKRLENAEEEQLESHEELRDITLRAHVDRKKGEQTRRAITLRAHVMMVHVCTLQGHHLCSARVPPPRVGESSR